MVAAATELGCARIIPVATERGREPLPAVGLAAAAEGAAERSGLRGPPPVEPPAPLTDAVRRAGAAGRTVLFCDERGRDAPPLAEACAAVPGGRAALLVGPREGFAPAERAALLGEGVVPVSLGARLLTPETAAVAGCALLHLAGPARPRGGPGRGAPL